jgi:hypothetical protein
MKTRTLLSLGLFLATPSACVALVDSDGAREGAAEAESPLSAGTQTINRVIPMRFVQFVDTGDSQSPPLTQAQIQAQIDGLNTIYGAAGIRFYYDTSINVWDSSFTNLEWNPTQNYTWPAQTSTAPQLAFNPTCSPTPPTGGTEDESKALFRAASFCARDGEIIVFTTKTSHQTWGAYPWEGNAIIMYRDRMTGATDRTFAHEVGHYLGLSHPWRGNAAQYDMMNSNLIDPETGAPAKLSDFWDLVYKPADTYPPTASNVYFSSRAAAQQYQDSSLRPIQGNSGWPQGSTPMAYLCETGKTSCPAGKADDTLRMMVPKTSVGYASCNTDDPYYSANCACVLDQSNCEIYYTGDPQLKGYGFNLPNGQLGLNVMIYGYPPQSLPGDRYSLSASQIEQIKRVLTYDVPSTWFAGTTGRRTRLGVGQGTWADWEHLGGSILGKPAVTAMSTGKLDVIVRNVDNVAYNKVLNPGGGWWPSQTGWSNIGGSLASDPAAVRRDTYLDLVSQQTGNNAANKVYDPNLGGFWPSQTTWSNLGGALQSAPVMVSWSTSHLDVLAASTSNHAIHKSWDSSTSAWSPSQTGWTDLGGPTGGVLLGAPSLSTWGVGHLDAAALGTDNRVYTKPYNNGWASSWSGLGTRQFAEAPALVSWGANHLDVIGRGLDGRAHNKVWSSSGWWPSQTGDWADLGGSLAGPIAGVSWSSGRLDLVARGTDGSLLYKSWEGGAWWPSQTDWAKIAVDVGGDPVIVSSGTGKLDIFVRGTDGHVWHRARTP